MRPHRQPAPLSTSKYETLYHAGAYDRCEGAVHQLQCHRDCRYDGRHLLSPDPALDVLPSGLDHRTWELLLENNLCVARGLRVITADTVLHDAFSSVTDALFVFLEKFECLHCLGTTPLALYLAAVYNSLWWGWLRPHSLHGRAVALPVHEDLVLVVVRCFVNVLEERGIQIMVAPGANTKNQCMRLVKEMLKHFVDLEVSEAVLVYEICLLALQVLLELQPAHASSEELIATVNTIQDSWRLLEAMMAEHRAAPVPPVLKAKIFKFGMYGLNATVDGYDAQRLFEVACILSSLSCIHLGSFQQSLLLFSEKEDACKDGNLRFLWHFLQAYAYYHLEDVTLCMLHLKRICNLDLPDHAKVRFHILRGNLLSFMKDHMRAHAELQMASQMSEYHNSIVYYVIRNMKDTVADIAGKRQQQLTENVRRKYKKALTCIHEFLETCINYNLSPQDMYNRPDFEHKVLMKLHERNEIRMPEVSYLIAKEMCSLRDVPDTSHEPQSRPSRIIANCFVHTLISTTLCDPLDLSKIPSHDLSMPPVRVLYHEAVVALMLDEQYELALSVCTVTATHPLCTDLMDNLNDSELAVFSMDEDIVSLLLMAILVRRNGDDRAHEEYISRCRQAVAKFFLKKLLPPTPTGLVSQQPSVIHALAARIYLLKALALLRAGRKDDAIDSLKRAVGHNAEDQLVQHHILAALAPDADADLPEYRSGFPEERCCSLALHYLLHEDITAPL